MSARPLPRGSRRRRLAISVIVLLLVCGGLAVGARALWSEAQSIVSADGCDFGATNLDLDQSQVASTMVGVVARRALPERAAVLTIAAALQESKLTNIPSGQGDRDSVGVLQQRPSQGWGTATQISDIRYATGKFLDALVKVDGWETGDLSTVIQEVQRSADGSAYAKHETQAQAISDSLTGVRPETVSCTFTAPATPATAVAVAARVRLELPVTSAIGSGTTVQVPGASWTTVGWLITHAASYGIETVSYSGHRWSRSKGWRDDASISSAAVTATLKS